MNNLQFYQLPWWWYTVGLGLYLRKTRLRLSQTLRQTGLRIFARHLFEPLYGDYTRSGVAVGVFLRFFILLVLAFWTMVRILLVLGLFFGYVLVLPTLVVLIFGSLLP